MQHVINCTILDIHDVIVKLHIEPIRLDRTVMTGPPSPWAYGKTSWIVSDGTPLTAYAQHTCWNHFMIRRLTGQQRMLEPLQILLIICADDPYNLRAA